MTFGPPFSIFCEPENFYADAAGQLFKQGNMVPEGRFAGSTDETHQSDNKWSVGYSDMVAVEQIERSGTFYSQIYRFLGTWKIQQNVLTLQWDHLAQEQRLARDAADLSAAEADAVRNPAGLGGSAGVGSDHRLRLGEEVYQKELEIRQQRMFGIKAQDDGKKLNQSRAKSLGKSFTRKGSSTAWNFGDTSGGEKLAKYTFTGEIS
jgi:hypothetical protein